MKIKALILKILILAILLIATYLFSIYKLTQGPVDNYYSKFTYKSNSLVIGLSRTTFGIVPSVIETEFEKKINLPVLNFALDGAEARYGDMVLKGIKHKIDTLNSSKKGLFLLSVLPGSFLIPNETIDDESLNLDKDKRGLLAKMNNFNQNPNYEYVRKYYDGSLYKAFEKSKQTIKKPYPDGWVEFKTGFENYTVSKKQVDGWKLQTLNGYKTIFSDTKKSNYRIHKFKEIITFLKKFGTVILVRIPTDIEFVELENNYWPNFNEDMNVIAKEFNVAYLNYSKSEKKYDTFDGSHLFGYSAKEFTKDLCDDIKSYQKIQVTED